MSLSAEVTACALASASVLEAAGWPDVHARARSLASLLTERLAEQGREPAPRGETTLVSFFSPDPEGERERLAENGVVVRNIPGRPWLRASVGAWNDEGDLDRLLGALTA
jgi:selenocysteine lyase/cysteine desulfurase